MIPAPASVHEQIILTSAKNPEKVIVSDGELNLTGSELLAAAERVGNALTHQGALPGDRIGINLENSAAYIIAMLACLQNGLIFTPIPFQAVSQRLLDILVVSGAKMIVARRTSSFTANLISAHPVVLIDVDDLIASTAEIDLVEKTSADPASVAYCIFTSGSTGAPKGVLIEHRSLMNFVTATIATFGLQGNSVALCLSPFHFDGAFGSLFSVLVAGGALVIHKGAPVTPTDFIRHCERSSITHASFSPSFLSVLARSSNLHMLKATPLRTIGLGGEDCNREDLVLFKTACPDVAIFNRYGPTETTVVVASCELTQRLLESTKKLPIGRPGPGVDFYIVDEDGKPIVGSGIVGELCIGGIQVMRGYIDDPDLTSVVLDRSIVSDSVIYHTGDLVERSEDDNYVYIGRKDDVVNRNGVRIALGEIDAACRRIGGLIEAGSIVRQNDSNLSIELFVVYPDCPREQLVAKLLNELPRQMLPDKYTFVSSLPRLPSGKLDRAALQSMASF